jgi:hypothetical protein
MMNELIYFLFGIGLGALVAALAIWSLATYYYSGDPS